MFADHHQIFRRMAEDLRGQHRTVLPRDLTHHFRQIGIERQSAAARLAPAGQLLGEKTEREQFSPGTVISPPAPSRTADSRYHSLPVADVADAFQSELRRHGTLRIDLERKFPVPDRRQNGRASRCKFNA